MLNIICECGYTSSRKLLDSDFVWSTRVTRVTRHSPITVAVIGSDVFNNVIMSTRSYIVLYVVKLFVKKSYSESSCLSQISDIQ